MFAKFGFYGGTWGYLIDSHRIGKAALVFQYEKPIGHFKTAFSKYIFMQIIIKDTSSKSLRSFRALHSAISKLNKNVKLDWGCRSSAAFMGLSLPRDMIIYLKRHRQT